MAAVDALRALRVDRLIREHNNGHKTVSTSEPYPSRERLYHVGESGEYDDLSCKVVVDLDVILAILDEDPTLLTVEVVE